MERLLNRVTVTVAVLVSLPIQAIAQSAGDWYLSLRTGVLQLQLARCEQFAAAGNEPIAKSCRDELLNADDYLRDRAKKSKLPLQAWTLCSQEIQYELPLAARCITAIEDRCLLRADGQLQDFIACSNLIQSGAYTANPAALRLKLDTPRAR